MSDDRASDGMTVGAVADIVGVSVRTLHHWDQIGLVVPSARTDGGYRQYSHDDLGRIHRVLVYRELGFALTAIGGILDEAGADPVEQLSAQQQLLADRIERLQHMSTAVDALLERKRGGPVLTVEEQSELFGRDWRPQWADEAEERWGTTSEWRAFETSARALSSGDRTALGDAGTALFAEIAEAKRAGLLADGAEGIALAERHRAMLAEMWPCTPSMHAVIGRTFVDDPRFRAGLDEIDPGLSRWFAEAVFAAARAHGIDPRRAQWE